MKEENVTKLILDWLEKKDWKIICYDFPQSGTGTLIHLNKKLKTTKNKGAIIPDIIAYKNNIVLFFENKDRFVMSDFCKINDLRIKNDYSESINNLMEGYIVDKIYYGIGIPSEIKQISKAQNHLNRIDFLVSVDSQNKILINYDIYKIF